MSYTRKLREFSRSLHVEQRRIKFLASRAEECKFVRTIGPALSQVAEQLGLYRLTVDAVADAARDRRGARRRATS